MVMASWADVRRDDPRLVEVGEHRLLSPGVVLVGTIRRDGTPRVSPVEPVVLDGELWLCMMLGSTKARDLRRDPRVLVHSMVTGRDGAGGEFKVRGLARPITDIAAQRHYADEVATRLGWHAEPGRCHLFVVDISDITFIRYDAETGDQYVTRWPGGLQYVRHHTSDTSVGPPEPTSTALG
jgi:hypothetical protein